MSIHKILDQVAPNVRAFIERISENAGTWREAIAEERIFLDESSVIAECAAAIKAIRDWYEASPTEVRYQWAANNLDIYEDMPKDLGLV